VGDTPTHHRKIIGPIAFQAVPIKIANVHRHANDCIVVPSVWVPGNRLQARCHRTPKWIDSHVRNLQRATIHNRS
jgi:hypothetical protein